MRKAIQPKYYPQTKVVCQCGNTFTTGSTREMINVEICAVCHPAYTGQNKYVDTKGRIEKFQAKVAKAKEFNDVLSGRGRGRT